MSSIAVHLAIRVSSQFFLGEWGVGEFFTASSLLPHGSAFGSPSVRWVVSGERACGWAVWSTSRWRRHFVWCESTVSSGVRTKVSSAFEGRLGHLPECTKAASLLEAVWSLGGKHI
jgi:hypothetical protein